MAGKSSRSRNGSRAVERSGKGADKTRKNGRNRGPRIESPDTPANPDKDGTASDKQKTEMETEFEDAAMEQEATESGTREERSNVVGRNEEPPEIAGEDKKTLDLRDIPGEECSVTVTGNEDEVIDIAVNHITSRHGYTDTTDLRDQIRDVLRNGNHRTEF